MSTQQLNSPPHDLEFDLATKQYGQLIGGELVASATTTAVIDPGTGQPVATCPVASPDDVDRAVEAAQRAFRTWSAASQEARSEVLLEVARVIEQHAETLARLTTLEQGKPLAQARDDVSWSADFARYFAQARLAPEVLRDGGDNYVELRRRPIGVVGAITPWNFPLFQAVYKMAPALAVGNTMVLKPSPTTPLATLHLAELLRDVLPAGVFNVLGDAGAVGPMLVAHPGVQKISFTGSTATGRTVMSACGATLKRLTLELGGNDAAIVLDDADVEAAAKGISTWAFANSGQVCVSIKRIYAPRALYGPLCEELARLAGQLVVGHGLEESTQLGPVQNAVQHQKAIASLDQARTHGTVIAGGATLDRGGYYVQPTVVRDIAEDTPLVTEETFAPIRSVLVYDSVDEAIERANDTPYGLGSSLWGSDVERALGLADRLQAGTTWVNHHFALTPDVPFGGVKQSGLGVEFGRSGLEEFTDVHVVNLHRG